VTVADYKNAYFNHWGDCTSTRVHPLTATASIVRLTAMYTPTLEPPPQCGNPSDSVTVQSAYLNGTVLTGEYVNLRLNGNILIGGYTPITFSGLTAGLKYEVVVYWFGNTWFRHFSDGSLNRYYFVMPGAGPTNLTALYQYVPRSQIAALNVIAELPNGTVIGGDSVVNGSIVAKPGMWMTIGLAGQNSSLTGGYTSSSMTPFYLMKDQNYTIVMSRSYGPYSFSHWKDNNSTDPVRSFFLTTNSTGNVAVYVKNGTGTTTSSTSGIILQPAGQALHQGKFGFLQPVVLVAPTAAPIERFGARAAPT
jgi:hypothetical protein